MMLLFKGLWFVGFDNLQSSIFVFRDTSIFYSMCGFRSGYTIMLKDAQPGRLSILQTFFVY